MPFGRPAEKGGFIMVYVIGLAFAFGVMFFGILGFLWQIGTASDFLTKSSDYEIETKNRKNAALKIDAAANSNGSNEDRLSCSGGTVSCSESGAVCSTSQWVPIPDGIADSCDNDDYRPTYATGGYASFLAPGSKTEDDDDNGRLHLVGFVPPESEVTAFAMNSNIARAISLDPFNGDEKRKTPLSAPFSLRAKVSTTGLGITVFRLDKSAYDSIFETKVLDRRSGTANVLGGYVTESGDLENSGLPFSFDATKYDYLVKISNPSSTMPASFDLSAMAGGIPTYLSPVTGNGAGRKFVPAPYYGTAVSE